MCGGKRAPLGGGHRPGRITIVVTVAFAVRQAEQRHQREVLLHADTGLAGQVFCRHEIAAGDLFLGSAPPPPAGGAGIVYTPSRPSPNTPPPPPPPPPPRRRRSAPAPPPPPPGR